MSAVGRLGGSCLKLGPMGVLSKHKCPECGKEFECGAKWTYSHDYTYYCSYHCYRVWEREQEEKARKKIEQENERLALAAASKAEYDRQRYGKGRAKMDLQTRTVFCAEKLAVCEAEADKHPVGSNERKNALHNAARWRNELMWLKENGGEQE